MRGLVYSPPRTADRESACPEQSRRAQIPEATAHWAVFEPFRGLGLVLWEQGELLLRAAPPAEALWALSLVRELQPPESAILGLVVRYFLLEAYLDSTA